MSRDPQKVRELSQGAELGFWSTDDMNIYDHPKFLGEGHGPLWYAYEHYECMNCTTIEPI